MISIYFVSPVGSDPTYRAKRELLAGLESELGVRFFFPLEQHQSFALESAKKDLAGADLVLADLSLERPSCYFELGVAEAVGARVVLIAIAGTAIHQTGNAASVHMYTNLAEYGEAVRQAVSFAVRSHNT